jgi:cell division protein FtsI/penicillin-binding protein 2
MSKNWRANLVLAVIFIAGGIVLSRLFYLQINKGNYYKAMAQGQQMSIEDTTGERGAIYFASGEPLALTERDPYVFISPDEINANDKENVADLLSKSLDLPKSEILAKANISGSQYQIIQNGLTKEKVAEIKNLKLKGVYIDYKQIRSYPNKTTAAQLSGYLNKDGVGQYGLEGYYNDVLKGKDSVQKTASNPFNFFSGGSDDNINGSSLYLTVDYNIQYMAEKLLAKGVKEYDAKSGEIIVMDPATGAIIAMAQYPLFDPNNYQKEKNYDIFQNDSIQKIFEPGSIFKSVTMAAAINEKAVTPETTFDDKLGYRMYGSYKVSNYSDHVWGLITMTNALEHSINTGLMFAEEKLGHQKFYSYLENFGFFENTGIDLSGEVHSANTQLETALEKNNPNNTSFPNASFGQGIGMTPLHITASYCAIANGGNLVKPYIVKQIDNNGQKQTIQPEITGRIISNETSTTMKTMMISVIENGYGHLAKIPGYYIAGKTGTSQVPWTSLGENKAGYSPETWQTFLGFAPAYNPKFVALVKLDNPTAVKTSEYSATPIFHDLAKYILDYWQIPPDYNTEQQTSTASPTK